MKETEKAYIAGIIDGEGCIYISVSKCKSQRAVSITYHLGLRISNNNVSMLNWVLEKIGFGSIYHYPRKRGIDNTHELYWSAKQASKILQLVYKYIVSKKDQADIAIKFQDFKNSNHWGRYNPISDEDSQYMSIQKQSLMDIHKNKT